jgi:hypothetical protein
MRCKLIWETFATFLMLTFGMAVSLNAQMGMGMRIPGMSGIWRPAVGSGAAYQMAANDNQTHQMEITVVGKEEVEGKTGYWIEMAMGNPGSGGDMYVKYLVVPVENGTTSTRMIMQRPGQEPMEMDTSMMNRGQPQSLTSDIQQKAERVGSESVTVPAGTFTCEHYRMKDGSADVWISDKVAPWGIVKTQGKDSSMVLTRVVTDAKDHITGTPKKFDPMQMMRDRMGQRGQ